MQQITEHDEQVRLIRWCDSHSDPRLASIYSHLNGMRTSIGTARKHKLAGARKGIPDLFLPIPSRGLHGLYIEMKRSKGGTLSREQKQWIAALKSQGYEAVVCKGCDSAIETITQYLGISHG